MEFIDQYGEMIIGTLITFMLTAAAIVGNREGPKAEKAVGIINWIVGFLRRFGPARYKDEPGTLSMPGKGDTGLRVKDVEQVL